MPKGFPKNGINAGWFKNGSTNFWKGRKLSKTHRKKLGSSKKGLRNDETNHWLGDKVGYHGLHSWLQRNYGKPDHCEICGRTQQPEKAKRNYFEWSNKTGKYCRDIKNWWQLCHKCHMIYDLKK